MAEAGKAATAVHQDSGNAEAGQAAGGLAASSASSWATHPCSAVSCAIIALLPRGLLQWRSRQAHWYSASVWAMAVPVMRNAGGGYPPDGHFAHFRGHR